MKPEQLYSNVYSLLAKKEEYFQSLFRLTKSVVFEVENEYVETIDKFYSDRQNFIDQIDKVDKAILVCENALKEQPKEKFSGLIKKNSEKKEDIKRLISEILAIDNENQKKVKALHELLSKEIRTTSVSKKAASKYTSNFSREDGVFFDTKK